MKLSLSHLRALELRRSHERVRLTNATAREESALRTVWLAQIEKEITDEQSFLGLSAGREPEISDNDLYAALLS